MAIRVAHKLGPHCYNSEGWHGWNQSNSGHGSFFHKGRREKISTDVEGLWLGWNIRWIHWKDLSSAMLEFGGRSDGIRPIYCKQKASVFEAQTNNAWGAFLDSNLQRLLKVCWSSGCWFYVLCVQSKKSCEKRRYVKSRKTPTAVFVLNHANMGIWGGTSTWPSNI